MIEVEQIPSIGRAEAMQLAEIECKRVLDLVSSLDAGDWDRPTDCTDWTVKDIVVHLLGAAEALASIRELLHLLLEARRLPQTMSQVDRINAVEVRERRHLPIDELPKRLAAAFPRELRGRRRVPALLRRLKISVENFGRVPVGWMIDIVFTRDPFIHRVDISRATGKPMVVTSDHEGRIVADIVRDWAARHGTPSTLRLTGPAGGTYLSGNGGEAIELDAIEFCRVVSGRQSGEGLLKTPVLF